MTDVALSSDQISGLSIGVIIAVVVLGLIVGLIVNAIVARVVIAVVAVGLAVLVWTQRTSLENRVRDCDTNVSFVGVHVNLSSAAQSRCNVLSTH
jgi:hypothetical protein